MSFRNSILATIQEYFIVKLRIIEKSPNNFQSAGLLEPPTSFGLVTGILELHEHIEFMELIISLVALYNLIYCYSSINTYAGLQSMLFIKVRPTEQESTVGTEVLCHLRDTTLTWRES